LNKVKIRFLALIINPSFAFYVIFSTPKLQEKTITNKKSQSLIEKRWFNSLNSVPLQLEKKE